MNALALSLLIGLAQPSPTTAPLPDAPASQETSVTVRVTSALGSEDDDQVRDVVTERVASVLAVKGFSVGDGSPRLLLIRVGRSTERPTDYEVQISAARNTESAPKRVETFECSCSAPELLDELDRRLAMHLPSVFEEPDPELELDLTPDPPPSLPSPPPPAEAELPPADEQASKPWPSHQDTPLFAAGVATIGVGGSILVGLAIGLPIAIADDSNRVPNVAYATPALGVAGIVTGAILLRVNKKRHKAHLTSLAPLSGSF